MMMGSLFTVRRARMVNDAGATNITSLVYQNGRDFGLNSQLRTIGDNWRFWILEIPMLVEEFGRGSLELAMTN